jgi:hypothetical protein
MTLKPVPGRESEVEQLCHVIEPMMEGQSFGFF